MIWHDLWQSYFFKLDNPESWQEELAHTVTPAPENMELCEAIRKMSQDDNAPKRPTLKALRFYVYKGRKRTTGHNRPSEGCQYCRKGWIDFYNQPKYPLYFLATPCACDLGIYHMETKYHPQFREQLMHDARTAQNQEKDRRRNLKS